MHNIFAHSVIAYNIRCASKTQQQNVILSYTYTRKKNCAKYKIKVYCRATESSSLKCYEKLLAWKYIHFDGFKGAPNNVCTYRRGWGGCMLSCCACLPTKNRKKFNWYCTIPHLYVGIVYFMFQRKIHFIVNFISHIFNGMHKFSEIFHVLFRTHCNNIIVFDIFL